MKQTIILIILLFICNFLYSQVYDKGDLDFGFAVGTSFANFINSEAPHKIYLYGSDKKPFISNSPDITKSPFYNNYKTNLFKDILFRITTNTHIEYFIKNNLSIQSGISFETKGVNLNYSTTNPQDTILGDYYKDAFVLKIRNNYLIVPILLKKYLLERQWLFIEGGVYTGYLVSSRITFLSEKIGNGNAESGPIIFVSIIDNELENRKITNKFDFGFSIGTGINKRLSSKLIFKSELLMNFGLVKVDSKYNNEFYVINVSSDSNPNYLVRSTNYYGLNSKAKNFNLTLTIGIGYKIGK
jgi:hypothetical protein